MNDKSTKKDWLFDIGIKDGELRIEPIASTIPDVRFHGLSRDEMVLLKKAIDRTLKAWPMPLKIE